MYSIQARDDTKPELLVVPTNGALYMLIESINQDCLPAIDVDVILSLAIDALIHKHSVDAEVGLLAKNLFELDECVCHCLKRDKDKIPINALEKTANALLVFANAMHHNLINNGMYCGDYLHYEFARIADNDNLLLRRVGG